MKLEFPKCCCLVNDKDCPNEAPTFLLGLPMCKHHVKECEEWGVRSQTVKITGDYLMYFAEALDAELEGEEE